MQLLWTHSMLAAQNSGAGDDVLLLYAAGYVILVGTLALVLLASKVETRMGDSSAVLFDQLGRARLRWLTVSLIFSLAGLPPFFFFGCKLGLLSLLLSVGSWYVAAVAAGLIFLGWAAYFNAVVRLLAPQATVGGVLLRKQRITAVMAVICLGAVAAFTLGFFFLDDLFLYVRWLLVF